jgi:hypothetical protein
MVRGRNRDSNPGRGLAFFPSNADNGLAEALDN